MTSMEVDSSAHEASPSSKCGSSDNLGMTAFRCAEKRYKLYSYDRRTARRRQVPETDFTDVVDFAHLEANTDRNRASIVMLDCVGDQSLKCFAFDGLPGFRVFSGALTETEQQELCRDAVLRFGDSRRHPNHLSTHASNPRSTRRYEPSMRWSTLGYSYNWTSKTYSRECYSPFPQRLKEHVDRIMHLCDVAPSVFEPQTSIVNYFPLGSMMMAHQDLSEESVEQPLVSISLGCSCIFLMGTSCRHDAPHAIWLRSGDVAVFSGPSRTAFHSVPRIMDDCPPHLCSLSVEEKMGEEEEEESYWREQMRHMRININVRQVYAESSLFLFE